MKISMTQVKVFLAATAATIAALAEAQSRGIVHLVPPAVMAEFVNAAVAFGILGASPIGRLIFKDAPSNDIVPPAERGAPGKPASDTDTTKPS